MFGILIGVLILIIGSGSGIGKGYGYGTGIGGKIIFTHFPYEFRIYLGGHLQIFVPGIYP